MSGQPLGQFVTAPFSSWANRSQKVFLHSNSDYHLNSMAKMDEFLSKFRNPSEVINIKLDMKTKETIQNNMKVIESLIKVALLCGCRD